MKREHGPAGGRLGAGLEVGGPLVERPESHFDSFANFSFRIIGPGDTLLPSMMLDCSFASEAT